MDVSERKYILVRSKIDPEKNLIGIGYDGVSFKEYDNAEKIIEDLKRRNYTIIRRGNQIRRFKGLKKGDVIVVPLPSCIALGYADEEEIYDPKCGIEYSENQRAVNFIRDEKNKVIKIPKANLDNVLQDRLKIRMTVVDLGEFKQQIDSLLDEPGVSPWDNLYITECENEKKEFKQILISNIRGKKIHWRNGGIGLENLVKELLIINGYNDAEVLSKRKFQGHADADIAASNMVSRILVQVKHHDGNSGQWGIEQLKEIKRLSPEEYNGYQLVLLTSGSVDAKLKDEAELLGIIVIDGDELVDWILSSIDKLGDETKKNLGISEMPHVIKCC